MPRLINKKFLIYIFLFLLLGTLNNKNLKKIDLFQINQIKISGLESIEKKELIKKLNFFLFENLFFLDELKIHEALKNYNLVENYHIFKKYPSTLDIKTEKTKYLAYLEKNEKIFYFGSNSKLIEAKEQNADIPFIFGNFDGQDFLRIKKIIDDSQFDFNEIKNFFFFPSGRLDLETNKGVFIKLPIKEIRQSLDLSFLILKDVNFKKLKIIDLRQKNQVIVNGK